MSAKIAIAFHCRISGGAHPVSRHGPATPPINREHAVSVVTEQVNALHASGLVEAASEFIIGLNGTLEDYRTMKGLAGECNIVVHGPDAAGELPTLAVLEDWVKTHPDWYVLYFHGKGVCWPGDPLREAWRRCLMRATVWNWEQCVAALDEGCEMAGGHWLTAGKFPISAAVLPHGIFGGNFWWATTKYLSRLKPVQPNRTWEDKYDAEMWPVSGLPDPVRDFAPHWPSLSECGKAL